MPSAIAQLKLKHKADKKKSKQEGVQKSSELERAKEIASAKSTRPVDVAAPFRPAAVQVPSRVAVPIEQPGPVGPKPTKQTEPKTVFQLETELQSLDEKVQSERDNHTKIMLVQDQLRVQHELALAQQAAKSQPILGPQPSGTSSAPNPKQSPRGKSRDGNRATMDVKMMMGFSWKERSKIMDPLNSGNPLHDTNDKQQRTRFEFADSIVKQVRLA